MASTLVAHPLIAPRAPIGHSGILKVYSSRQTGDLIIAARGAPRGLEGWQRISIERTKPYSVSDIKSPVALINAHQLSPCLFTHNYLL